MGCQVGEIVQRMRAALEHPVEPPRVTEAPCQEVVEPEVDLTRLPIPRYQRLDGGPYVTAGVAIVSDPDLGRNLSFHRLMVRDAQHFVARLVEGRGTDTAGARCWPMRAAQGCRWRSALACRLTCSWLRQWRRPRAWMRAGLRRRWPPQPLVRATTVPLEVFADAELVIEGLLTRELDTEGPFPDLTGTMDTVRRQPVLRVWQSRTAAIRSSRAAPGRAGAQEPDGDAARADHLRGGEQGYAVHGRLHHAGRCSWLHAVVQIVPQGPDDAKRAIEAAFKGMDRSSTWWWWTPTSIFTIRWMWSGPSRRAARGARCADLPRSTQLQPGPVGPPGAGQKTRSDKIGVDATIPWGEPREGYVRVAYG
jgi:hypothetical protein